MSKVNNTLVFTSYLICMSTRQTDISATYGAPAPIPRWQLRAEEKGIPSWFTNQVARSWVANFETPRVGVFVNSAVKRQWHHAIRQISEIARCVPIWIRFADLEEFIDAPLKPFLPTKERLAEAKAAALDEEQQSSVIRDEEQQPLRLEITPITDASSGTDWDIDRDWDLTRPPVNPDEEMPEPPPETTDRLPQWDLVGHRTEGSRVWTSAKSPFRNRPDGKAKSFFEFYRDVQAWTYSQHEQRSVSEWEGVKQDAARDGSRIPKAAGPINVYLWDLNPGNGGWDEWTWRYVKKKDVIWEAMWEDTSPSQRFYHPILQQWHLYGGLARERGGGSDPEDEYERLWQLTEDREAATVSISILNSCVTLT